MSTFDIPGYTILRPIDSGGMATVYLAEQKSLAREVAIKVMADHLSHDAAFTDRFKLEARIASHLDHPNIVTIFDYGTITSNANGSTLYLVMAYIEGQDLKSLQPKLSLVSRLKIIQDIAHALDYAHKQGVIHRDIKPQNILVQKEGHRALLTDFGVAKARLSNNELTQTGMTLGTPHYMSPEQALGKAVDHRADIYSLGVVLYFLLTGHVPFDGESEIAIGIKHLNEATPKLPEMFSGFQSTLDKALAKEPDDRYQSAGEFAKAVGEISIDNLAALVQSISCNSEAATRVAPAITRAPAKPLPVKQKYKQAIITAATIGCVALFGSITYGVVKSNSSAQPTTQPNNSSSQNIHNMEESTTNSIKSTAAPNNNNNNNNNKQHTTPETVSTKQPNNASNTISCNYKLIKDWGSGWQGEITLENNDNKNIAGWNIELELPGNSQITQSFITKLDNEGTLTILTPQDWNKNLKANKVMTIGFQGAGKAPKKITNLRCFAKK